ncbi:MAG TPA: S8 family peptidase [Panacibacter sp.]|nr:S8 family peptidase [Panacibacter sp.]
MKKNVLTFCMLSLIFIAGCKKDLTSNQQNNAVANSSQEDGLQSGPKNYIANEILVKFKGVLSETSRSQVLSKVSGNVSERIFTQAMQRAGNKDGIYVVHVPIDALDAIAKLKGLPDVEVAEPNYLYQHDVVSNDPYFTNGSLWGMYGATGTPINKYGSRADKAWSKNHTGSSSVFVGVIDEGAMYSHADLAANFWTNPYDALDGIDNDGNGYIDDVHGWDFDGNNNSTFDGTQDDHGTHVSGTIGAVGGNGIGVAGVNWSVTMISAKFLGTAGGTTANGIKAIDYITDLKTRHTLNLVATNNSWGGGSFSQLMQDAIERSNTADILFVAAAGNGYGNNNDVSPHYPSSYPNSNIISVASIASNGSISSFSNIGVNTVDIGAPGSGIYSTLPGAGNTSTYGSYDGTSMATPHVTGAAALYASRHPGVTAAAIKAAILGTALPTPSLSGKCVTGARLNVSSF